MAGCTASVNLWLIRAQPAISPYFCGNTLPAVEKGGSGAHWYSASPSPQRPICFRVAHNITGSVNTREKPVTGQWLKDPGRGRGEGVTTIRCAGRRAQCVVCKCAACSVGARHLHTVWGCAVQTRNRLISPTGTLVFDWPGCLRLRTRCVHSGVHTHSDPVPWPGICHEAFCLADVWGSAGVARRKSAWHLGRGFGARLISSPIAGKAKTQNGRFW